MKTIKNAVIIIWALFMIWVCWSFFDITTDNSTPNPTHNAYNFFVVTSPYKYN